MLTSEILYNKNRAIKFYWNLKLYSDTQVMVPVFSFKNKNKWLFTNFTKTICVSVTKPNDNCEKVAVVYIKTIVFNLPMDVPVKMWLLFLK